MTTIAVVRKNGYAAIAADTMTKWGSGKETADYIVNHDKIFQVGDSYLGVTGNATFQAILPDIVALLIFVVILVPLGAIAFRLAIRRARAEGSLVQY